MLNNTNSEDGMGQFSGKLGKQRASVFVNHIMSQNRIFRLQFFVERSANRFVAYLHVWHLVSDTLFNGCR